jgi:hypothetical protein
MATINNGSIIKELIANNGYYSDDPRVAKIVEYTNSYGVITWGVTWSNENKRSQDRYLTPSPFVINPKLIWEAK